MGTFAPRSSSIDGYLRQGTASVLRRIRVSVLANGFDDKIIGAAGQAGAALFVCAKSEHAGNLPGGGELLRKARVYVCKPDRLVMQASSELIEECSC